VFAGRESSCVESLGHGGAKEGEQEVVPDRCKEEQGARPIESVPQTQACPLRRAPVAIPREEQGGEVRKGEVGKERNCAARERRGEDDQGAEERDHEITDGARLGATRADGSGETWKIGGYEIAS
jgi:hypothetical protein